MRRLFAAIGLCMTVFCTAQITVMSYNVENFFYPETDSINPDIEYTKNGSRHWSYTRYLRKTEQIARVIANSVENGCPAMVALNEVEDVRCLQDLCRKMPHYPYRIVHYDSHDHRGIDVALLYDTTRCRLLNARVVTPVARTRDLLYAALETAEKDTLHVIACHLPSQLSGAVSRARRDTVKTAIRQMTDSLWTLSEKSKIIVCGDMNMAPEEDLLPLKNLMVGLKAGTHKYRGIWTCLDQFYVSEALLPRAEVQIVDAPWLQEEDVKYLGTRPRRTFVGFKYNRNGFSDHLPVLLRLKAD